MSNRRRPRPPKRSGVVSITVHGVHLVTQWSDIEHAGCTVCSPVVLARGREHRENLRTIHAASLRATQGDARQAPPQMQETPGLAGPEVSTPATSSAHDGRAARAHSATLTAR